jgi:hypothetical protein
MERRGRRPLDIMNGSPTPPKDGNPYNLDGQPIEVLYRTRRRSVEVKRIAQALSGLIDLMLSSACKR